MPHLRHALIASALTLAAALPASAQIGSVLPSNDAPGRSALRSSGSRLAGWNIAYQLPAVWRQRAFNGGLAATRGRFLEGLIAGPGLYRTPEAALRDQVAFLKGLKMQGQPAGQPQLLRVGGGQALIQDWLLRNPQGHILQARSIAIAGPHGAGFNVLGFGPRGQAGDAVQAASQLASSLRFGPVQVNRQAMARLAGRWTYYQGKGSGYRSYSGGTNRGYNEQVWFDGRGQWRKRWDSYVGVTVPGGSGGGTRQGGDQGTYAVIGNLLVLQGRERQTILPLVWKGNAIVAGGRTYIRN